MIDNNSEFFEYPMHQYLASFSGNEAIIINNNIL